LGQQNYPKGKLALLTTEVINYLQLSTNAFALGIAGWIYSAYIKNLNASLFAKDEQTKIVEKMSAFWKDKAQELEKKSPEHMAETTPPRSSTCA
jgi:hypothetical protein